MLRAVRMCLKKVSNQSEADEGMSVKSKKKETAVVAGSSFNMRTS